MTFQKGHNHWLGRKHKESSKKKMSVAKKKIKGVNHPRYGIKHTEESKRKISESQKGHTSWCKGLTKETDKRIRKKSEKILGKNHPFYGKHQSPESNKKRSEALMGRIFSDEHIAKISGSNNPNWKGGTTSEIERRTHLSKWKRLAAKMLSRDNHWCLYCRKRRGIVVHHMLPVRIGGTDEEINLITLCRVCHKFIEHKIIT